MMSWHDRLIHYEAVKSENTVLRFQVVNLENRLRRALKPTKKNYQQIVQDMPTDSDRYVHAINAIYSTSLGELQSPSRIVTITAARQVLYFLLNRDLYMSTTQIGRLLHRDHSTVIYGIKAAERLYPDKIAEVRKILK